MFSSTHQKFACVLIILSAAVLAHSQSVPAKDATSVVSGKVTIKGKAAAGVVIVMRPYSQNFVPPIASYKGTTDVNGEYRITNLPGGRYWITPLAPAFVNDGGSDGQRTLLVSKGETVEHIDFPLIRGAVITGKIVDAEGHPVVEQEVRIFTVSADNDNFSMRQVPTDDRGIYRAFGLKPGKYKVSAGQSDRAVFDNRRAAYKQIYFPAATDMAQAAVIELSEGSEAANIDITLGPTLTTYTASGRIVDSATGQPLAGVAYGVRHFVNEYNTSSISNGAVSNSRGEFRLENLVAGNYAVQINAGPTSGWRADEVRFEVVDQDVSGLVVQARRGATISGVVVVEGTDDKSARDDLRRLALYAILATRADGFSQEVARINADGSFHISAVAAGSTVLQLANSPRFRILRVERNGVVQGRFLDIKEGEDLSGLRVILAYGNATIRGTVEVANGPLPSGARLYVTVRNISEESGIASSGNPSAEVDARGQFVLEGVFPGTYEVSAGIWSSDGRMTLSDKKQQVAVTAGCTSNVSLSVELDPKTTRP